MATPVVTFFTLLRNGFLLQASERQADLSIAVAHGANKEYVQKLANELRDASRDIVELDTQGSGDYSRLHELKDALK